MSNLLNLLQSLAITPRRSSVAHGGEYCSACPACGDGGKGKGSDRFHIWPDKVNPGGLCNGRFWCRQCDISGDTIEFVMRFDGLNFPQACASLGIRLKDGTTGTHYSRPTTPSLPAATRSLPRTYAEPAAEWSQRAAAFLADCQSRLQERPDALAWLATRGISPEAARTYGLGYNESSKGGDRYRPRLLWGLEAKLNDKGKEKKLWLPKGWVIPMFSPDGRVLQLRIRRLDADVARFASDIRYCLVDGSSAGTMVLHPEAEAHAVVESGLDAILIAAAGDGQVGAVTTWNASARPDTRATEILQRSQCVLNCFDFDAAGEKEQAWWEENFRRYKRWPVPVGKDPGEAYEAGVNIRQWLSDGLPPGLQAGKSGADAVAGAKNDEKAEKEEVPPERMSLKIDWRKCKKCGFAGTPLETIPEGRSRCYEDSEEQDSFVVQLCPNCRSETSYDRDRVVQDNITESPIEPEPIPGLQWCLLCDGDRFWAGEAGGFFCLTCQPVTSPGRLVRATVPRREYVVD